ncbi:MAG: EAL domain-containing protein [Lachnospiraceae bacterium]|nr:EAL domain-containing protein [Lachnospiraceae bacterium]
MADSRITEEVKRKLDSLFDALSIVSEDTYVYLCDMRYDYSRWSKILVETFGMPSEYMYGAGTLWEERVHPDDRKTYRECIDDIFNGKSGVHDMQYRAKRADGEYDVCTCRGLVIRDEKGNPEYFGGSIRNHSQNSHIDSLTGLRNQFGFFEDLKSKIRNQIPVRVGMVGIAKLTEINEVYGYKTGNKILQIFGRYLLDNVGNRGGTYRLDGSKFAIISATQSMEELASSYEKIRTVFRKGIKIDDLEIMLELNAGILSLDDFDVDDQTIYSCLSFAYDESKINRHGDLIVFRNELTGENRRNLEKLHAIRASINQGKKGFYLLYQPVVDAKTEKIIGAEALLRWKNEEYGVVPPDLFIPFLEKDPLFPALGEWILETALNDAQKLLEYIPDFMINVNLSYAQLEKADFTEIVWNTIRKSGFSPEHLCLEITERCRLLDMDLLRNVMVTLRAGGVRIALDDFGTGFSSVGLVKNLPFDTIKIDRSFVQEIEEDEREKRMINNFTDMAGTYGAKVCVEGIETAGMREILKEYGIHSLQGYYYSRPVPIEEIVDRLRSGTDNFKPDQTQKVHKNC